MEFEENFTRTSASYIWEKELPGAELKHSIAYTVVMIVVYSFVFIVGIIGNTAVILVIGLRSEMRTVTNLFLLNLAIADTFVLLFCLPATLIASICKSWILGSFMCWGVAYIQGVSVVALAYSLVAISIDRCKTICNQSISPGSYSKLRASIIIALIWSLALLVPMPWAFVFQLKVVGTEGHIFCVENWQKVEFEILYFICGNLLCCYIIPFLLIFTANVKIWLKVSRRRVPQTSVPSSESSTSASVVIKIHKRTKRGVGRMLAIVTFTYLITWLPLYIIATRIKISDSYGEIEKIFLKVFVPLAQWLSYGNSCVNPIFYAFFNSHFLEISKSLLPSWMIDRIFESCRATRRSRHKLQVQEFALNSRYEHGIRPSARQSRRYNTPSGSTTNRDHSVDIQSTRIEQRTQTQRFITRVQTAVTLGTHGNDEITAV